MVLLPEQPQISDYLALILCLVAGLAWGWILAGCWIDALKDEAKRKQEAQQQLNERFYNHDGRNE